LLVAGIISPHPPILIPEIGGPDTKKVHKTVEALQRVAKELGHAKPDELIIISPHQDHGFQVPMHFLGQHLPPEILITQVLVTEPSYRYYYEFGKTAAARLNSKRRRYGVVASGDLSHVLKADGPYGYNPAGPKLDERIVRAVRGGDAQALLGIEADTLEEGAECGLRSILFLLGVFEGSGFKPHVLSYEGPFGVGYLVATLNKPAKDQARSKAKSKSKTKQPHEPA